MSIDNEECIAIENYLRFQLMLEGCTQARDMVLELYEKEIEHRIDVTGKMNDGSYPLSMNISQYKETAVLGISAGVVVATGEELERVKGAYDKWAEIGPKLPNGVHWSKAIHASANFVRHAREWKTYLYEEWGIRRGRTISISWNVNDIEEKIRSLEKTEVRDSLLILWKIFDDSFLNYISEFYDYNSLAEKMQLYEVSIQKKAYLEYYCAVHGLDYQKIDSLLNGFR